VAFFLIALCQLYGAPACAKILHTQSLDSIPFCRSTKKARKASPEYGGITSYIYSSMYVWLCIQAGFLTYLPGSVKKGSPYYASRTKGLRNVLCTLRQGGVFCLFTTTASYYTTVPHSTHSVTCGERVEISLPCHGHSPLEGAGLPSLLSYFQTP